MRDEAETMKLGTIAWTHIRRQDNGMTLYGGKEYVKLLKSRPRLNEVAKVFVVEPIVVASGMDVNDLKKGKIEEEDLNALDETRRVTIVLRCGREQLHMAEAGG